MIIWNQNCLRKSIFKRQLSKHRVTLCFSRIIKCGLKTINSFRQMVVSKMLRFSEIVWYRPVPVYKMLSKSWLWKTFELICFSQITKRTMSATAVHCLPQFQHNPQTHFILMQISSNTSSHHAWLGHNVNLTLKKSV